jgi:hypothetical protein
MTIMVKKSTIFTVLTMCASSASYAFEEQDIGAPFSESVPSPVEIQPQAPIPEASLETEQIFSPSDPYSIPQMSLGMSARAPRRSLLPDRYSAQIAMNHAGLGTYLRANYQWNDILSIIPELVYRGGYRGDDFYSHTGFGLGLGANLQILSNFSLYGEIGAGYQFWKHRWEDTEKHQDRGHGLVGVAKAALISKITKNFSFIFQRLWLAPTTDSGDRFFVRSNPPKFEALFEYAI